MDPALRGEADTRPARSTCLPTPWTDVAWDAMSALRLKQRVAAPVGSFRGDRVVARASLLPPTIGPPPLAVHHAIFSHN